MILYEIRNIAKINSYYKLFEKDGYVPFTIHRLIVAVVLFVLVHIFMTTIIVGVFWLVGVEIPTNRYSIGSELFINAAIFAPILEEFQFRGFLKYSIQNISASLACWFIFFWLNSDLPESLVFESKYQNILILILLYFLIYFIFIRVPKVNDFLSKFQRKCSISLVYFSAILFGLIHLQNHVIDHGYQVAIVSTHVARGFILAYYRIVYGIHASILIHVLNNSLALYLTGLW